MLYQHATRQFNIAVGYLEELSTNFTCVTRVGVDCPDVASKTGSPFKCSVTMRAEIGLLISMGCHVCLQMMFTRKSSRTNITHVHLNTQEFCVNEQYSFMEPK